MAKKPGKLSARPAARDVVDATLRAAQGAPPPASVDARAAAAHAATRSVETQEALAALAGKIRTARLFLARAEAIDHARAAIALDPACFLLRLDLAELLAEGGDLAAAAKAAEEALAAAHALPRPSADGRPGAEALLTAARIASARGDDAQAAALLDDAVAHDPALPAARLARGDHHLARGDRGGAATDFRAVLAQPASTGAHPEALRRLAPLVDGDEALRLLTRAVDDAPADPDARLARAALFAARGEPAKALEDYDAALDAAPLAGAPWGARARYFAGVGEPFRAALDGAALAVLARIGAPVSGEDRRLAEALLGALGAPPADAVATVRAAGRAIARRIGPGEAELFLALLPVDPALKRAVTGGSSA